MANRDNYLTIPDIIDQLNVNQKKLEDGILSLVELTELLEISRQLNERIAILRYQVIVKQQSPVNQDIKETKIAAPTITKEQLFDEISTKKNPESSAKQEEKSFNFSLNFGNVVEENTVQTATHEPVIISTPAEKKDFSVNDKLANEKKVSVAEKLQQSKIEDLRSVIGLNQKFLFMNDLFEGEKTHYDSAIDTINSLVSKSEVIQFIDNEISSRFNWNEENESVKAFRSLIDRKFA